MGFDILKSTNRITEKYTQYLQTMFNLDDTVYRNLFLKKMPDNMSFAKGPYLDVVDSFEFGSSIQDLIQKRKLSADFKYIDEIYQKTLYCHQEEALNKLSDGRNIVVSTGTGSGKTESFLIPILDSLMKEKQENGKISPGVRALLIYPMNALANDQISRLRRLLKEYPYITFGSYTGQTEEKETRALAKYMDLNGGQKPKKNELISREKMKETPPHILITNYSMLEYLMLRPKDNSLFQGPHANHWHYIVLDEAHTYSGSTGIEVSMLLRRLKGYLFGQDIHFILTSATLGGKDSDKEVAQFGRSLCDADFESSDVIRAKRIQLIPTEKYQLNLSTQNYRELRDITESGYSDEAILKALKNELKLEFDSSDYSEYLFDVLLCDSTFWKVKQFLARPNSVKELCRYMGWKEEDVSAFVAVASKAVKNRQKLFDSRYHMFLRATDGVFITLGKHKDLSLVRKKKLFVDGNEYRYFEAATCGQCHAIYILGTDKYEDGLLHLVQESSFSSDTIRSAYLVGDQCSEIDDDSSVNNESLNIKHFELCPHCGFIRTSGQVNGKTCEHSKEEYIHLVKVEQSERTGRVTKCIQCEGTNSMGILRSFFSGQEASTSVIGTALFEELPESELVSIDPIVNTEIEDDSFGFDDEVSDSFEQLKPKAKQFIAFSDNRQAAAFFATYFNETYEEFLYSRIVNKNMKELTEKGRHLSNFVQDMSMDFREHHISGMMNQHPDYEREAWKAIMREFINSYARNSLMGMGLMDIAFDESVKLSKNTKFNLTEKEVTDICMAWIRNMMEDNAIKHGQNFSESDIAFYSNNGHEGNYVLANPEDKYSKSFLPKTDHTTNRRFDYLNRIFLSKGIQVERDVINGFMSTIWNKFLVPQRILVQRADHKGSVVNLEKFKVIRGEKYYRCSKCQRITSLNVNHVCPAFRCDGVLEEVDVESVNKDNHYYRIYNEMDLHPLRVVEHTAQLDSEEAYKLQEQFKKQNIDVLSCSTTFEMGVDIGDLETVFMRNMPPSPSNYTQRAGRAGRSSKAAALALTFCNKSNHDFSYFENPISMISGEIQPPLFKVENEKIGIRHVYSAAISFFWRKYWTYYGNGRISDLFGEEEASNGYTALKSYLESQPKELQDYLMKVIPDKLKDTFKISTFGWVRWMFDEPVTEYPNLKTAYERYRYEIDSLFAEKKRLEENNQSNAHVIYRINTYTKENIITFLSRNNIFPKYGFPVDTVDLEIATDNKTQKLGVSLSRDLAMAISEYAPGCEVVAAGNLIRSRYIRRMAGRTWKMYDFVKCPKCNAMNVAMHLDTEGDQPVFMTCEQCENSLTDAVVKTFIIPEFGFISEPKLRKPTLIKPDRTFRTEASMVAKGLTVYQEEFQIGDLTADVVYMEDGEIAVMNKTDFYVCSMCGYAESNLETKVFVNYIKNKHRNSHGYTCQSENLKRYSLGYAFKTDAVTLRLNEEMTYEEAYSVMQSIVLSACKILNIDDNEISGCLQFSFRNYMETFDFIIYDSTPGGAGHVKRLANKETLERVLSSALSIAEHCDCGGEEADTSCYKCLRTYRNQMHHDILRRRYVIDKLQRINGI